MDPGVGLGEADGPSSPFFPKVAELERRLTELEAAVRCDQDAQVRCSLSFSVGLRSCTLSLEGCSISWGVGPRQERARTKEFSQWVSSAKQE